MRMRNSGRRIHMSTFAWNSVSTFWTFILRLIRSVWTLKKLLISQCHCPFLCIELHAFFFIAVLHISTAPQLMLSLINILVANKSSSVFEYDTTNLAHLLLGSISSSLHTLSNSVRSHFQISPEMFIQIQVWPLAGLWVILLKDPSLPQPAVQKALELVLRLSLCLAAFSIPPKLLQLTTVQFVVS